MILSVTFIRKEERMYKHVLFDLDGTLTDSKEGIVKSVVYGLKKLGITTIDQDKLDTVVGPPLMTTFLETYGFSMDMATQAYAYFQERYSTIGKFENRPYDGIIAMLRRLQEHGVNSYLATSKPLVHAQAIADKFGLTPYFTKISGSALGGVEEKDYIINQILQAIGFYDDGDVVMVGDRKFDVIGARKSGIPVIVVSYGYGNEAERRAFPADAEASTVQELSQILLN